jgi:hypothetical protein
MELFPAAARGDRMLGKNLGYPTVGTRNATHRGRENRQQIEACLIHFLTTSVLR